MRGDVYLLHIEPANHNHAHYLGFSPRSAEARFADHRRGYTKSRCRTTGNAVKNGCELVLVRIWRDVPKSFENELKNAKQSFKHLCPVCLAQLRKAETS